MFRKTNWFLNTGIIFIMISLVFLLFAMGWQHFAGAMFNALMASPENHDYGTRMTLSLLLHVPDGIARLLSLCLFAVGAGNYILCVLTDVCEVIITRLMRTKQRAVPQGTVTPERCEGLASSAGRNSCMEARLHD